MSWWSVVRGILSGRELGSVSGWSGVWGDSGWMLVVEGWEADVGISGEVWGRIWKRLEVCGGLLKGEGMLSFFRGRRKDSGWNSHALSLDSLSW